MAGWYYGLSDNFKEQLSPVLEITDTWGFEIYYNFEITPWFHVTPDIQIVQSQREEDDIAVILGVRGVIDF